MTEHRMFPAKCPWCDHPLDAATFPSGRSTPPRAGDLSVCLGCGKPLRFAEVAGLVVPEALPASEVKKLPVDIQHTLHRMKQMVRIVNLGGKAKQ